MNLRRIRFKLRRSLSDRGARATFALLVTKALRPAPRPADRPKEYAAVHPFDQQYGVETSGLLPAEELTSNSGNTDL